MTWPITWPKSVNLDDLDPNVRRLCELYATASMNALTLHRVGGDPITISPDAGRRTSGHWAEWDYPLTYSRFFPYPLQPSMGDLTGATWVSAHEAIDLPGPVGQILEVRVDDVVMPVTTYRIEDDRWLVRTDGKAWPSGDRVLVTYVNSHPVDEMGEYAAGVMAAEWLKLIAGGKGCRLPASVTSVSRQGISIEKAAGMFPDGVTGLPEIDAYLMLWNPHGLKVAPRVYSPDLPVARQVR